MRLISSNGRINAQRLRTGQLEDAEDWSRVTSAIKMLKETKIFIDDTPGVSPEVLRSKCRRLKREHDLGLVVIDYLQLMKSAGQQRKPRESKSRDLAFAEGLAMNCTCR